MKIILILAVTLVLAVLFVGCGVAGRAAVREGAKGGARYAEEKARSTEPALTSPAVIVEPTRTPAPTETRSSDNVAAEATEIPVAESPTPQHSPTATQPSLSSTSTADLNSTHPSRIAQDEAENLWPAEVKEQLHAYRTERGLSLGAKFEDCFISRMASSMLDPKPEDWSRLPQAERDSTHEELLDMWRALEPDYVAPLREECFVYAYGTVHASYGTDDDQRLTSSIFVAGYMLSIGVFSDFRAQMCEESHEDYVHRKLERVAEVYGDSPDHAGVDYTDYEDPDISGPIKHGLTYTKHLNVHVCP